MNAEEPKKFVVIGNKNAITYKEVFPLLKNNKIWTGYTPMSKDLLFLLPEEIRNYMMSTKKPGSSYRIVDGVILGRSQSIWLTNIDHGKRHEKLLLDTMEHNLKYNKRLKKKLKTDYGVAEYPHYDNYDAIEIPFTECIPSDYNGVMGVPISFLDKYNPEQFEIIDITKAGAGNPATKTKEYPRQVQVDKNGKRSIVTKMNDGADIVIRNELFGKTYYIVDDVMYIQTYPRILIRPRKGDRL